MKINNKMILLIIVALVLIGAGMKKETVDSCSTCQTDSDCGSGKYCYYHDNGVKCNLDTRRCYNSGLVCAISGSEAMACPDCVDTDGGKDINVKGTVWKYDGYLVEDTCYNGDTVNEQWCDGNDAANSFLSCLSGQVCDGGKCSSSCTNECSNGDKRCNGLIAQTCGSYDSDTCYEWPYDISGNGNVDCYDLGKTCSSGECIQSSCEWQCISETTRKDSCTGNTQTCSGSTPKCRAGNCVACLLNSDCETGYTCNTAGQCIQNQACDNDGNCETGENQVNCLNDCKCIDSDGGLVKNVLGTITIGTQLKSTDSCNINDQVNEYICDSNPPYYAYQVTSCGTGEICSNGKCSGTVNTCNNPDTGTQFNVGAKFCRWDYPVDEYLYTCQSDGNWESTICNAGCDKNNLVCYTGTCYPNQYKNEVCLDSNTKEYDKCNSNRQWEHKTENCSTGQLCTDGQCYNECPSDQTRCSDGTCKSDCNGGGDTTPTQCMAIIQTCKVKGGCLTDDKDCEVNPILYIIGGLFAAMILIKSMNK